MAESYIPIEETELMEPTSYQQERFNILKLRFTEYYDSASQHNIDKWVAPYWAEAEERFKTFLHPIPYPNFISPMQGEVFPMGPGPEYDKYLKILDSTYKEDELKRILREDWVGCPYIAIEDRVKKYLTSYKSIQSLAQITAWSKIINTPIKSINTIVEWGGGYGNLAKILKRLHPDVTLILLDIPLMACLQWLYLSTIFGEEATNLITDDNKEIIPKKINIIGDCYLEETDIKGDLFISHWALSESSPYAIDYVAREKDFFSCPRIFLAYQHSDPKDHKTASYLEEVLLKVRPNIEIDPLGRPLINYAYQ